MFAAETMIASKRQVIAGLAISAPIVAVLLLANAMAPVQEGNPAAFWQEACGVNLGEQENQGFGGFYQPRDGWYIYYFQGFHGQFLFRVPRQQAIADFPEVVRKVRMLVKDTNPPPAARWAAAVLARNPGPAELSPEQFLLLVRDESLEALRSKDQSLYEFAVSEEQAFAEKWSRIRRYWVTIIFEAAFFAGLTLFALWPWLRRKGRLCWGLHFGFVPMLLMLPYYSGYASWTFTSAGPSGGVLYPWIIVCFRGFPIWTGSDQWALEHFPKFLEPISQSLGPMLSISGGHSLGPVTALVLGFGIAICISVTSRKPKQDAAPNGDPTTRLGNSGVSDQPPSAR